MKKIITGITVGCLAIGVLLLSLMLFNVMKWSEGIGKLLLALGIIIAGSLFSMNGIDILKNRFNLLAVISLAFIGLSCAMALIQIFMKFEWGIYQKLLVSISIFSILFYVVVAFISRLGKHKLIWQTIVYLLMGIFGLFIMILIFGGKLDDNIVRLFIMDIILMLAGVAMLYIFSRKYINGDDNNDFVKIKVSEYEALKSRVEELEKLLAEKTDNTSDNL